MSGFNLAGHSISPPPGSIMMYMGATDPDGWVICDGVQRTNTNGMYNNLVGNSNFGSFTTNDGNFTPIDLRSCFLGGTSITGGTSTIGGNSGSSTITIASGNLPVHYHGVIDEQHTHTLGSAAMSASGLNNQSGYDSNGTPIVSQVWGGWGNTPTEVPGNRNRSGLGVWQQFTGISKTYTDINGDTSATASAINILPPYKAVNYIMKY